MSLVSTVGVQFSADPVIKLPRDICLTKRSTERDSLRFVNAILDRHLRSQTWLCAMERASYKVQHSSSYRRHRY